MDFVCPHCKAPLSFWGSTEGGAYGCTGCAREYPVVCGIPDFRLHPDPYIGIVEDREKGRRLSEASAGRSFEDMVRYYYEITDEDPSDLARHWLAHSMAEIEIARLVLEASGLLAARRAGATALLDLGCSTGGLLIAAQRSFRLLIGVDVAFRWLAIGKTRLREAGVDAKLICANAEALPFADNSFGVVTATDLAEHLLDPRLGVRETGRVLAPGGVSLWTWNNRYALLPDPHVHLWGVGLLPRRWQASYVALRRKDLHVYHVRPIGARELERLFAEEGLGGSRAGPAPLFAPHLGPALQQFLKPYNRVRRWPAIAGLLRWIGPRLWMTARTRERSPTRLVSPGPFHLV